MGVIRLALRQNHGQITSYQRAGQGRQLTLTSGVRERIFLFLPLSNDETVSLPPTRFQPVMAASPSCTTTDFRISGRNSIELARGLGPTLSSRHNLTETTQAQPIAMSILSPLALAGVVPTLLSLPAPDPAVRFGRRRTVAIGTLMASRGGIEQTRQG